MTKKDYKEETYRLTPKGLLCKQFSFELYLRRLFPTADAGAIVWDFKSGKCLFTDLEINEKTNQ